MAIISASTTSVYLRLKWNSLTTAKKQNKKNVEKTNQKKIKFFAEILSVEISFLKFSSVEISFFQKVKSVSYSTKISYIVSLI